MSNSNKKLSLERGDDRSKIRRSVLKTDHSFSSIQLLVFALIFAAIGGVVLWRSFAATPANQSSNETQMLIRFKPDSTKDQQDKIFQDNNITQVKEISQIRVKVIRVPANAAQAVTSALSHNPAVDFIEEDRVVKPQAQLPNDPYFSTSSPVEGGNDAAMLANIDQAWDITEGTSSVNIAILDTGIKTSGLSDYDGQISSTWNVMNNSTDATTNAGVHGTYVAGAAAAAIDNGVGAEGVCPKCRLMIVQVGTDSGALWSDLASGLIYAADHGAKIANMSWAATFDSSTLSSATTYAHGKGMVLFAAAGNSNCDCTTYPSADPYVISVGGTNNTGGKAGDSNYGTWVLVTAPEGYITGWPSINGQPGYGAVGGTSLASPVAAGIAGLLFSYSSTATNTQIENAMESSAVPTSFVTKYGKIDALAALKAMGANYNPPTSVPAQTAAPKIYYSINGVSSIAPLSTAPQVGQMLVRGIGGWTGASRLSVAGLQWQRCNSTGAGCVALTTSTTYTVQTADVGSTIKLVFNVSNSAGTTPASVLSDVVGGSASTPIPGDINSDGHVDILDLSILLSDYGTTNPAADINGDGTVSVLDLSILLSHYGQ